jgi:type VI secretion system secreted protein VgrG
MTARKAPNCPYSAPQANFPCDATVQHCPLASSSPPSALSASCRAAPAQINLPKNVNDAMQNSYSNSFPGGKSQERGATLIKDSSGNIGFVNEGTGTSGTFSPNRTVPAGDNVIGTYHTHPYDDSEGGYKGVSFSGADIYYADYHKEPIYVDAGTNQFMIMPTNETPAMDQATVQREWDAAFKAASDSGKGFAEASRAASNEIAKKYKMAYYEGCNGTLNKVSC